MAWSGTRRSWIWRVGVLSLVGSSLVAALTARRGRNADPDARLLECGQGLQGRALRRGRRRPAIVGTAPTAGVRRPSAPRRGRAGDGGSGPGPGGARGDPRRSRRGALGPAPGRPDRDPPRADAPGRGGLQGLAGTLPARGPTAQGIGLYLQYPAPAGRARRDAGRADGPRRAGLRRDPPLDQDAEHGLEPQRRPAGARAVRGGRCRGPVVAAGPGRGVPAARSAGGGRAECWRRWRKRTRRRGPNG